MSVKCISLKLEVSKCTRDYTQCKNPYHCDVCQMDFRHVSVLTDINEYTEPIAMICL